MFQTKKSPRGGFIRYADAIRERGNEYGGQRAMRERRGAQLQVVCLVYPDTPLHRDTEGRLPPATTSAERPHRIANPVGMKEANLHAKPLLKRSASSQARCVTTGAGRCNSDLLPNQQDDRFSMLGDAETALGR